MKRFLYFIFLVSIAHIFYGQEKYTITGELPDHSLDNTYLRLVEMTALTQEYERMRNAFSDSILVKDGKFFYEGIISRKPFLAWIRSPENNKMLSVNFVIEAGDIRICVTNWAEKAVVSGTPINEDYNTYMVNRKGGLDSLLYFFNKYASYPDVIRLHLSIWIRGKKVSKKPYFSKFMQVVEKMPEPDRSILLGWRNYTIQRYEYREKVQPILDSIRRNRPQYVEIVPKN